MQPDLILLEKRQLRQIIDVVDVVRAHTGLVEAAAIEWGRFVRVPDDVLELLSLIRPKLAERPLAGLGIEIKPRVVVGGVSREALLQAEH